MTEEHTSELQSHDNLVCRLLLVKRVLFRSEEHTSELQSHDNLACRLLLETKRRGCIVATSRRLPAPPCGHRHARAARPGHAVRGQRGAIGLAAILREFTSVFNGAGGPGIPTFFPPRPLLPS